MHTFIAVEVFRGALISSIYMQLFKVIQDTDL